MSVHKPRKEGCESVVVQARDIAGVNDLQAALPKMTRTITCYLEVVRMDDGDGPNETPALARVDMTRDLLVRACNLGRLCREKVLQHCAIRHWPEWHFDAETVKVESCEMRVGKDGLFLSAAVGEHPIDIETAFLSFDDLYQAIIGCTSEIFVSNNQADREGFAEVVSFINEHKTATGPTT